MADYVPAAARIRNAPRLAFQNRLQAIGIGPKRPVLKQSHGPQPMPDPAAARSNFGIGPGKI
jgi:hypothetical protein